MTRSGKAYAIAIRDIQPATGRASRGVPAVSLLPSSAQDDPDAVAASFILPDDLELFDIIMLTQHGRIKRLPLTDFTNITSRGLVAIKLRAEDNLASAYLAQADEQIVLATSNGRLLRFTVDDAQLPIMSRTAQGQSAIRVGKKEHLVGAAVLSVADSFFIVTAQGYAKRMAVSALRLAYRGEIGTQMLRFANKTDRLIGLVPAPADATIVLHTNTNQIFKLDADAVDFWGKDGTGDPVVSLDRDETIAALTCVLPATSAEEDEETSD